MPKAVTATSDTRDLRERILLASIGLLEEQGIAGLSMREVARRAGVSHQAPYHHFADREAILAAIAQDGFAQLTAVMRSLLAPLHDKRPSKTAVRELVARLMVEYVQFSWKYPGHFGLMFHSELCDLERFPAAESQAQTAMATLHEVVAVIVLRSPQWHDYRLELATTFWSIAHGFASLTIDGPLRRKLTLGGVETQQHLQRVSELAGTMVEATLARDPRGK